MSLYSCSNSCSAMFWKRLFATSLALLLDPTLGMNTSASGFGFHLVSSPPTSKSHTSCRGHSTMYPFPCFSFNPRTVPSLPMILLSTRPSFHNALSFASLFNNTTAPLFGSQCSPQLIAVFLQGRGRTPSWTSFEGVVCFSLRISCAYSHPLLLRSPNLLPR